MNRRQLAFVILFNAIISLVIALVVIWVVEARRPDPEALAILYTPPAIQGEAEPLINVATPTPVSPAAVVTPAADGAASTEATRDFGETELYIVQTGDSLSSIADRFRVPINDLVELNNLPNPDFVFVGQRLQIPSAGSTGSGTAVNQSDSAVERPEPVTSGVLLSALEAPGDLLSEAVQITNDTDRVINLSGWTVDRADGPSYTFGNVSLFPGNYIWLHTTGGEDTSIALYWNRDSAAWVNGTTLRLRNPQGTEVATSVVP